MNKVRTVLFLDPVVLNVGFMSAVNGEPLSLPSAEALSFVVGYCNGRSAVSGKQSELPIKTKRSS